jgi:hypothetical protein
VELSLDPQTITMDLGNSRAPSKRHSRSRSPVNQEAVQFIAAQTDSVAARELRLHRRFLVRKSNASERKT